MTADDTTGNAGGPPGQPEVVPRLMRLFRGGSRRLLVWGPGGTGKTTLTADLAAGLEAAGTRCAGIAADPGSPGFGVPRALAVGRWRGGGWRADRLGALCTLDAFRYRLPLIQVLSRRVAGLPAGPVLVDAPGVVRGPAAQELPAALIEVLGVELVLAILPETGAEREAARTLLKTLGVEVMVTPPSSLARRRSKKRRARDRTVQWDAWLAGGQDRELCIDGLRRVGRASGSGVGLAGFQLALRDRQRGTTALGEYCVGARKGFVSGSARPETAAMTISLPCWCETRSAGRTGCSARRGRRSGRCRRPRRPPTSAAAGVGRLVPFHFYRRCESAAGNIYDEVEAAFGGDVLRFTGA